MAIFLGPSFPASRAQHISDLHSKFALGPRQSATAEIRRGKKRKIEERNHRAIIIFHRAATKRKDRAKALIMVAGSTTYRKGEETNRK